MLATLLALAVLAQDAPDEAAAYIRAHRTADDALLAGDPKAARASFERCLELAPRNPTVAYGLACSEAQAGDTARACALLQLALEWGFADAELASWDADLAAVRADASWPALLERMRRAQRPDSDPPHVRLRDTTLRSYATFAEMDPTGTFVAQGDSTGRVLLLDARSGRMVREPATLPGPVWRIAFHPSGRDIAVLTTRGKIYFLGVEGEMRVASGDAITSDGSAECQFPFLAFLAYDPTGERVLVRANGRGASLWTSAGALVRSWPEPKQNSWYVDLAWSGDGRTIAWPEDGVLSFLDGRTGVQGGEPLICPAVIHSVALQPGGELVATGLANGRMCLWNKGTHELVHEQRIAPGVFESERSVNSLAFTADGARLAYAACEEICIGIVDTRTRASLYVADSLDGHWCEPVGLLWSPDASRLWFSPGCGGSSVLQCGPGASRPRYLPLRGYAPSANPSELAAICAPAGVACFDTRSARGPWFRVHAEGSREVLQAPSGHFSGDVGPLKTWKVCFDEDEKRSRPLSELAARLFDPKRVRAARDGVELMPFTR